MSKLHILYTETQIAVRVEELAKEISASFPQGRGLTVVSILSGSVFLTADLVRKMTIPVQMDFFAASSYDGDHSTGKLAIRSRQKLDYQGESVLLIDDILDTGLTLKRSVEYFLELGASEVKTCVLLNKEGVAKQFQADWCGFSIPPKFVVGYGLDYNEEYRTLPYIGYLEE